MAEFNFKQTIYAGMICIAGADDEVTKKEIKLCKEIFGHHFDMSRKEFKEVQKIWEERTDDFTDLLIEELKIHTHHDQKEALMGMAQFILERKKSYNMSGKVREKGIDKDKLELNLYDERFEKIKKGLGF